MQGPYPNGFALLQPDLSLLFPDPARGASAQSFRMIVRPDLWGNRARIRLSNAFGTRPVRFESIVIGLQFESSAVVPGTHAAHNLWRQKRQSRSAPAQDAWSDPVTLPFVPAQDPGLLPGRKLAVSFTYSRRKRTDDLARQGADHLLPHQTQYACQRAPKRTKPPSRSAQRRCSFLPPST